MVGQDGILEIAEVDVELEVIAKTYDAWVKNWSDTYVPRLMYQQIWFKTDPDLVVGDLVYSVKKDSTMGMVEDITRGREAFIKYGNSSEQKLSLIKGNANYSTYQRYTE